MSCRNNYGSNIQQLVAYIYNINVLPAHNGDIFMANKLISFTESVERPCVDVLHALHCRIKFQVFVHQL